MSAVMHMVLALCLIFSTLGEVVIGPILSTGKYENTQFEWAAGISDLMFNVTTRAYHKWEYLDGKALINNGVCQVQKGVGDYNITCSSGNTQMSTFTIFNPPNRSNTSDLVVTDANEVKETKSICIKYCKNLNSFPQKFRNIESSEEARFNEKAVYSCNESSILIVDSNFSHPYTTPYMRNCQFNAVWNGTGNIICSYAATSVIGIAGRTSNYTFQASEVITLVCTLTDHGNPIAESMLYKISYSNSTVDEMFTVNKTYSISASPDLNNANITCQGINKYTEEIDNSTGVSPSITLHIQFGPISHCLCDVYSSRLGESAILDFTFEANPAVTEKNLNLSFTGDDGSTNKSLSVKKGSLTGTTLQTYSYRIEKLTVNDVGTYNLEISSPIADLGSLTLARNLTGEDTPLETSTASNFESTTFHFTTSTTADTSSYVYAIVGAIAGALIILLVIVLACRLHRRRKEKNNGVGNEHRENPVFEASSQDVVDPGNSDKEERLNPLYGSSGTANNEKEERVNPLYGSTAEQSKEVKTKKTGKAKKSEKEERKNPLYATSADGNGIIEDAYAEIDKTKKTGNLENQPPVFSVESVSGDTYAEVKKSKKKPVIAQPDDTYAEVKKDKGKQVGNLHGTSDETT